MYYFVSQNRDRVVAFHRSLITRNRNGSGSLGPCAMNTYGDTLPAFRRIWYREPCDFTPTINCYCFQRLVVSITGVLAPISADRKRRSRNLNHVKSKRSPPLASCTTYLILYVTQITVYFKYLTHGPRQVSVLLPPLTRWFHETQTLQTKSRRWIKFPRVKHAIKISANTWDHNPMMTQLKLKINSYHFFFPLTISMIFVFASLRVLNFTHWTKFDRTRTSICKLLTTPRDKKLGTLPTGKKSFPPI